MNWTKILKTLIIITTFIILYVPFIVSNGMFFPYITGKAFTFRIATEIIFFLWLILAVIDKEYRPKRSWVIYSFLAFVVSLFFSNLFGQNPTASFWSNFERMEGWVTIVHLFALVLSLGSTLKKTDWNWIFNGSILLSFFMSMKAFTQISEHGFNHRVDTTLGNSTYLGIYMLINAFLALYLLVTKFEQIAEGVKDKSKVLKIGLKNHMVWIYVVSFVLTSIITFQTGTRGSMLGWIGGLILMGLLMIFLNKGGKRVKVVAASVIGVVLVSVALLFVFKDSTFIQNTSSLKRITSISLSEGTAKARIINWKIATEGVKERPILGWGQSNFNYVFDKYYLPEHYGNETWFDRVHNIFFDWLIAGGIIGLLLYLSIWVSSVAAVFKTQKLSGNQKAVVISLMAAYFCHNLFVFDQIASYIYFAFMLALIYSLSDKEVSVFKERITDTTKYIAVIVLVFALPITMYSVNYDAYKVNLELIDGLRGRVNSFQDAIDRDTFASADVAERAVLMISRLSKDTPQQDRANYIKFALTEMEKQIEEDSENSRIAYILGSVYAQLGQFEKSEENILKAIELSPNKQGIRIPLIRMYLSTGQKDKAIALAKETYELDTSKDGLWTEYAKVLSKFDTVALQELINQAITDGEFDKVEKVFKDKIAGQPDDYNNYISLAALYVKAGESEKSIDILEETIEKFPQITYQLQKLINEIKAGNDPLGKKF